MTEPIDDIKEGIWRLRTAFERHHITPAVIEIGSPEEGMRLRSMISPLDVMPQFVDDTAKVWNQIELVGVIIRYPAKAYAMPKGGFEWR